MGRSVHGDSEFGLAGHKYDHKSGSQQLTPIVALRWLQSTVGRIARRWKNPNGVPISAIIFGGRRPHWFLWFESKSWEHGVLVGASVGSETTAAATGAVGVLRRDPMAMKPFCGYNFADYWSHWLSLSEKASKLPKIFHVNWFRQNSSGKFLWPGFGENIRVLEWIIARSRGQGGIRHLLAISMAIKTDDLKIARGQMEDLLNVDKEGWKDELVASQRYMQEYGDRLPSQLTKIQQKILADLDSGSSVKFDF